MLTGIFTYLEINKSNESSGSGEADASEESGESGDFESGSTVSGESGDFEDSSASGESEDYEDSRESGYSADSSVSKRSQIPSEKSNGKCTGIRVVVRYCRQTCRFNASSRIQILILFAAKVQCLRQNEWSGASRRRYLAEETMKPNKILRQQ